MLYTYERLSRFMKAFMIRKVTFRDGSEIYFSNGELYTINDHGEKDYESVKMFYFNIAMVNDELEKFIIRTRKGLSESGKSFTCKEVKELKGMINLIVKNGVPKNLTDWIRALQDLSTDKEDCCSEKLWEDLASIEDKEDKRTNLIKNIILDYALEESDRRLAVKIFESVR